MTEDKNQISEASENTAEELQTETATSAEEISSAAADSIEEESGDAWQTPETVPESGDDTAAASTQIPDEDYDEEDYAGPVYNMEDYEDYDDSIGITAKRTEEEHDTDLLPEEEFEDALPDVEVKVRKGSILKNVMPETPVIVFDNVTKEYEDGPEDDDRRALKDVSFSINKGEFVFIVGPSGSGKSTLIRLLMREIRPTKGSIYIAGTNLSRLRSRQVCKYRRSIGIVFQDFRLLEDRTVYENIAFAQKVIGAPSGKIARNVAKMLSLVGLRNKYRSYPNKLSGGEQQRVALARALINNPLILLADEPTGNLDPGNTEEIMTLLEEINMRGTTVVVVTHNHEIVDMMQKRVIMLREGVVVDDKKGGYELG